jgi:hypothetical protein
LGSLFLVSIETHTRTQAPPENAIVAKFGAGSGSGSAVPAINASSSSVPAIKRETNSDGQELKDRESKESDALQAHRDSGNQPAQSKNSDAKAGVSKKQQLKNKKQKSAEDKRQSARAISNSLESLFAEQTSSVQKQLEAAKLEQKLQHEQALAAKKASDQLLASKMDDLTATLRLFAPAPSAPAAPAALPVPALTPDNLAELLMASADPELRLRLAAALRPPSA